MPPSDVLLYRVCPIDPDAAVGSPYSAAFVPRSSGQHRIDNPQVYDTLYVSLSAAGAVAEAFGVFADWGDWLLDHPRGFSRRLVVLDMPDDAEILDLDDAAVLLERGLRPSRVVTRHRETTQQWALEVFDEARWAGVRWWSFYWPEWSSCGVWCPPAAGSMTAVDVASVEELTAEHPAVAEAAAALLRRWESAEA